ncbi:MAG: polysaccharide deacetylase family protein [Brumimicrobium sp.]|nr:polysaccharide deacetylase family protein [Brumimicrobium sp.]
MVLIYIDEASKRLNYILNIIFSQRGIAYRLSNDIHQFRNSEGIKFVYSDRHFDESYPQLSPADLLFEERIAPQRIDKVQWRGEEILSFGGKVDVLASIFYILTDYEDYTTEGRDLHGRLAANNSLVFKFGWINKLVIERWTLAFIAYLEEKSGSKLKVDKIAFKMIPSFDIDNSYAFKLKTGWRKWMSFGKDLLRFDKERIRERKKVNLGEIRDPYDTFDYISEISKRGFEIKMFWLLGDYALYDRNIGHNITLHKRLIRKMTSFAEIGLHPSYKSNDFPDSLLKEKERLRSILGKEIFSSRQHFLRLKLPVTYERLIKAGFKHDYTMGFADHTGFRTGISRPYKWFNLASNSETELIIHPFAYMDGTLNEYRGLTVEESKVHIGELIDEVRNFGGDFVFIWHNETIGDYGKWKGWSEVLEYTLTKGIEVQ